MLEALRNAEFSHAEARLSITATTGTAVRREGESAEATIARADEALYQEKENGRDRFVIAE